MTEEAPTKKPHYHALFYDADGVLRRKVKWKAFSHASGDTHVYPDGERRHPSQVVECRVFDCRGEMFGPAADGDRTWNRGRLKSRGRRWDAVPKERETAA